jgi:hypothetical protein
VLPDNLTIVHHSQIIALVAGRQLPAIYPVPFFAVASGLIAYGVDIADQFRGAASSLSRYAAGLLDPRASKQVTLRSGGGSLTQSVSETTMEPRSKAAHLDRGNRSLRFGKKLERP